MERPSRSPRRDLPPALSARVVIPLQVSQRAADRPVRRTTIYTMPGCDMHNARLHPGTDVLFHGAAVHDAKDSAASRRKFAPTARAGYFHHHVNGRTGIARPVRETGARSAGVRCAARRGAFPRRGRPYTMPVGLYPGRETVGRSRRMLQGGANAMLLRLVAAGICSCRANLSTRRMIAAGSADRFANLRGDAKTSPCQAVSAVEQLACRAGVRQPSTQRMIRCRSA